MVGGERMAIRRVGTFRHAVLRFAETGARSQNVKILPLDLVHLFWYRPV
jgi:hypothetical protein